MKGKILKISLLILKLVLTLLIPTANIVLYFVLKDLKLLKGVLSWLFILVPIAVIALYTCLVKFKRMKLYHLFSLALGFFATWLTSEIALKIFGLWDRGSWFGGYALDAALTSIVFYMPLAFVTIFIWGLFSHERVIIKKRLDYVIPTESDDGEGEIETTDGAEK